MSAIGRIQRGEVLTSLIGFGLVKLGQAEHHAFEVPESSPVAIIWLIDGIMCGNSKKARENLPPCWTWARIVTMKSR